MPIERAKQFMPFDALKGFKEALKEKEKIIVDKIDLCEDAIIEINNILINLKVGDIVKVVYFKQNEYIEVTGMISKIKNDFFVIVKEKIMYNNIYRIERY
ncbi:MAG: hypothetical protein II309_05945 [Bacilli bacterium]|jgi:hypothetical protein|nr:hypothetical protein [Bacilli bacterium]